MSESAAVGGPLISGYPLPPPGIRPRNPPGIVEWLWPILGAMLALLGAYAYGGRGERAKRVPRRG
jgi:hypothetical protein